jgi:hypothetical protein
MLFQADISIDQKISRPVESGVVLLPVHEFLRANPLFTTVFLEDLVSPGCGGQSKPLPSTLITFSSYLCTHASSVYTARSMGYANLALNILLFLVENGVLMEFMTQTLSPSVHLCHQVSGLACPLVGLLKDSSEVACTSVATKFSTAHKLDTWMLCIVAATQSP